MRKHVKILAWLQISLGILDLLVALAAFGTIAGIGVMVGFSGEPAAPWIGGGVAAVIGSFLALTGVPNILAGVGLLGHRNWARILALVLGVVNLINVPFGTALGIYTFWVLLDEKAKALFRKGQLAEVPRRDVA